MTESTHDSEYGMRCDGRDGTRPVIRAHDTDSETRAEYLAYIAHVYDVPMTLIRYEDTIQDTAIGCN